MCTTMAGKPPPEPNKSIDLRAAKAACDARSSENPRDDSNDIQTDGGVFTRPMSEGAASRARQMGVVPRNVQIGSPPPNVQMGMVLPRNVQMGCPPCDPRSFNKFMPGFNPITGAHVININNSTNVQIGQTNVMNFALNLTGMDNTAYCNPGSDSSDSEDEQLAIEDSKIQELRRCEREVSNIELNDIAQHVGLGWRRLVRLLGIQDYDVDEMYEEYGHRGLEEVIYQLLKRWKNEDANATVAEVLYQLQRCEMGHLARHLRDDDFHYTD